MKNRFSSIFLATMMGYAASCGYAAPYHSSGPSLSKEGVQITIAGERCFVNRSAEQIPTFSDDRFNLGVRLQVKNESSHVVVLSPDHILLSEVTGGERTVIQPREAEALSLQPGETKLVALDFEQSGTLDCHHEMALETQGAVAIEGKQVSLDPIRFLASR
jgi:hypothetical protein